MTLPEKLYENFSINCVREQWRMSKSFPKSLSLFGLRKLGYSELQERPEKSHRGIYQGVAKCRGSWVVSRGRGSWVWVNAVGKKVVQKTNRNQAKSCKIH